MCGCECGRKDSEPKTFCIFAVCLMIELFRTMKKHIFLFVAVLAMLASCSENKFKVDGTVEGAGDSTQLVLEVSSNGYWLVVDSVEVGANGKFSVAADAPEFPNIYRLRLGDKAICFPVDSLDHLTIDAKLASFATDYSVSGTEHAVQVMKIDKDAMQMAGGKASPEQFKAWKRKIAEQIVADPSGIVAYYAINKYVDDKPLFDPLDDSDLRIIGAVANAFYTFKPNDPRTDYLVRVLTEGQQRRRANSAPTDTVVADVTSLIDIKLQDYNGTTHSLEEISKKNHLVLLNFTIYQAEYSPVFNKLLNDIYTKFKSKGMAIYQISLDTDNVLWSQAAKNLPWITVYDHNGQNSRYVGIYQVMGVPTTFIIVNGDIVERVEDGSQLEAAVARHI